MPKASSKAWQASPGNQICGTVESIKVKMPSESSFPFVVLASVNSIDCKPTTKSREISGANWNERPLGVNFEAS